MTRTRDRVGLMLFILTASLALVGTAGAQTPADGAPPIDERKLQAFRATLKAAGFESQDGAMLFADMVQEVCAGRLSDTLANNPWPNAYSTVRFPLHPGVAPPRTDLFFQLGPNEALVLVGQTPPPAKFFSYQTFLLNVPNDPRRRGYPVGDAVNIGTIRTLGPTPFRQPFVYILTGHRGTERLVRQAALKAGYPAAILNVERISPVVAPLQVGNTGSWLALAHRVAVPESLEDLLRYEQDPPYRVFRLTPSADLARLLGDDPEPVPVLRTRGTGHTEMALYPALNRLRQAILDQHGAGQELDTKVWSLVTNDPVTGEPREMITEKPFVAMQREIQAIGATRDTNYLATYPNIRLRQGVDEFVIAYGVNHEMTGKATYSSISVYADKDRWMGPENGTKTSPYFGDSARHYLPDDPDVDMLYAIKVARNCGGEDHCMEVNNPAFVDIFGKAYDVNPTCSLPFGAADAKPWDMNDHEVFFVFRSYMEPATKVGPDDNELLYERAVYFTSAPGAAAARQGAGPVR